MDTARTFLRQPYLQLIAGGILLFIIFLLVGGLIAQKIAAPTPQVPKSIAQKITFPAYIPRKLPSTYVLDQTSYTTRESTLLFGATDKGGNKIAFSEQARTTNLNFATIYEQQFKGAQKLEGTPYPSVIGKTNDEKMHLLSIETPETWVLVTATTTNDEELRLIAMNIGKQ